MQLFWAGILIGVIVGANVGLVIFALCFTAGSADKHTDWDFNA